MAREAWAGLTFSIVARDDPTESTAIQNLEKRMTPRGWIDLRVLEHLRTRSGD